MQSRPSVLDMLAPDFVCIRDVPSVRAAAERLDAALKDAFDSGLDVVETSPGAFPATPDEGPIGVMQLVLNMTPGFADMRGRRADGSVIGGADFLRAMASFVRKESLADADMGCFYHFDLQMLRAKSTSAPAEAAPSASAPRRRRP